MRNFLVRRLIYGIAAVLGGTLIVFGLSRMSGVDPRYLYFSESGYGLSTEQWDRLGRELNLDKPVPVQYVLWLGGVLRGDMGESLTSQRPVTEMLRQRLPNTLKLAFVAWTFGTAVGVPLGVLSAVRRGTAWDYGGRGFALLGQTLPTFWVGIMAILLFSVRLRWLPSGTMGEGFSVRNYVLPAIVLGWLPAAGYMRLTRTSMLDVMDSEFMKLARAKGVASWKVVWKHGFRNAMLAPVTFSALLFVGFITGTVVTETIFSWPGMGRLAADAVFGNDFPVLAGAMLVSVLLYVGVTLLLDIIYALIDPRIGHA
ncbi:MAG: ABC transporter permease [Dehalococcoidia bacterium]|nr:ABC transporter permease [Dehalococcoidia bacterium]